MKESLLQLFVWGVALAGAILGYLWMRKPTLRFMAWPAFGVAGMIAGLQMKNEALISTSLAFTALAIVGQIFYDGWRRGRR